MFRFFCRPRSLCVAAIILACGLFSTPARAADEGEPLALMTDNADVVAFVKVAEILKSPAFQRVQAEFPEVTKKLDEPLGKKTKLTPRELKSIFVSADTSTKDFVVVITTSKAVQKSDIVGEDDEVQLETIGDYELYLLKDDKAVCLIDDNTIAVGLPKSMRAVLKRNDDAEISDELDEVWEDVDDTQHICVAATLGALMQQAAAVLPPNFPVAPATLQKIESGTLTANAGKLIALNADFNFSEQAAAEQVKALIDIVAQSQKQNAQLPGDIQDAIGSLQTSLDDGTLSLSFSVGVDLIINQVKSQLGDAGAAPAPAPQP